ncbi:hypothetical protein B0H11DRAFT_2246803 [Mycena galericulata]|nr:hypothetical protein B0H11DRAFT_2246803 [Mycena galericulata]
MSAWYGSSVNNPWVLNSRGGLVLESDIRPPQRDVENREPAPAPSRRPRAASGPITFKGPPSTIARSRRSPLQSMETNPGGSASVVQSAPPARSATSIRNARDEANRRTATTATARTRSRGRRVRTPPAGADTGHRQWRALPLTEGELYVDDARPPRFDSPMPHQICGICHELKSHPVSYKCGHSHCYVCIRMWLEKKWSCPECAQIMFSRPFRHYGEEGSLENSDASKDQSRVFYNWDGLTFPRAPLI